MNPLAATTQLIRGQIDNAGFVVRLLLRATLALPRLHRRLRFLLDNAFNAGVRALPVTVIVAAFAGAILAMQTGIELRRFGDTAVLGTITALSMCREMGPFITSVISPCAPSAPPVSADERSRIGVGCRRSAGRGGEGRGVGRTRGSWQALRWQRRICVIRSTHSRWFSGVLSSTCMPSRPGTRSSRIASQPR